ncbi:hypothetical protein SGPA1_20993 [Streptomyces misionensis JCM 4497]
MPTARAQDAAAARRYGPPYGREFPGAGSVIGAPSRAAGPLPPFCRFGAPVADKAARDRYHLNPPATATDHPPGVIRAGADRGDADGAVPAQGPAGRSGSGLDPVRRSHDHVTRYESAGPRPPVPRTGTGSRRGRHHGAPHPGHRGGPRRGRPRPGAGAGPARRLLALDPRIRARLPGAGHPDPGLAAGDPARPRGDPRPVSAGDRCVPLRGRLRPDGER